MKVLIGVCGIGYGHSSRQFEIASWFHERGHEVRFLTFGASSNYFQGTVFADRVQPVYVPWIACGRNGIRWWASAQANWRSMAGGLLENRRVLRRLEREGFVADLCVSDYEPVVAWYAKTRGIPLVTVDQQSKFLGYQIAPLAGLSRSEERARLGLFFPQAQLRIATSFYRVTAEPDPEYAVEVVPPIIRSDVRELVGAPVSGDREILVYLSRYGPNSSVPIEPLLEKLAAFGQHRFVVYTDQRAPGRSAANTTVRAPDRGAFTKDLAGCSGVICTAGHTLLSEAVHLGKPVLTVPLATFDQHVCAQVVDRSGIGIGLGDAAAITTESLDRFLTGLPDFEKEMDSDLLLRTGAGSVVDLIGERSLAAAV